MAGCGEGSFAWLRVFAFGTESWELAAAAGTSDADIDPWGIGWNDAPPLLGCTPGSALTIVGCFFVGARFPLRFRPANGIAVLVEGGSWYAIDGC